MHQRTVILTGLQRQTIERTIDVLCAARGWTLHAVNCRSNHVHAVVSVFGSKHHRVLGGMKAWCSRHLSTGMREKRRWWTKGGSVRRLYDTQALEQTVAYVVDYQDHSRFP